MATPFEKHLLVKFPPGDVVPSDLIGVRRVPVAVWHENGMVAVMRLSVSAKKAIDKQPPGSTIEVWTTTEDGVITERLDASCAYCGFGLSVRPVVWWRQRNLRRSKPQPFFCDPECMNRNHRRAIKGKRPERWARLARDRNGSI